MARTWLRTTGFYLLLGVAFLVLLAGRVVAATGILEEINFQGKVVNKTAGTNVADGTYSFTFRLYTVSSGGAAIWTETKNLTVTNGIFQTQLGDTTALPGSVDFNTDNIYLGVEYNSDGEMSPRVRFSAVPYAFNAAKVGGLTVTDTTGTLTVANGKTIQFADAFTTSGAHPLTLTTTASTNVTLPTTGTLATLAGTETLTNKTIGTTGLTFSGAATDLTTATNETLTLTAAGSGDVGITADNDTNFQIVGTVSGTSSQELANVTMTNTSSSGSQYGLYLDNAASTGVTEALLVVDNSDTDTAVGAGIQFVNAGGGFTVGIDMANLVIANIGASGTDFSGTGGLTLADGLTVSAGGGTITSGGFTIGAGALAVNSDQITADGNLSISAATSVILGDGGNTFTFSETAGPSYAGTARPTRQLTLSPEYPGASLTADGTNNTGTMTSDFCENGASADIPNTNTGVCNTAGDVHNYYSWTTNQGTAQDYDIWIRWRVPDNFSAWAASNPMRVYGKRTDVTNNAVTVYVYDTAGVLENTGGTQVAGTNWTQTAVEASFAGTYTPGSYMTIRVVLNADTGGDSVQVGEIDLSYLSSN